MQLLQAGFFHSDPHPGNLMRPDDQSDAKLVLIDFGLVATVEQEDMDAMVSSIVHLANKDYAALVDDFIRLQILPADCNRGKVIPLMDKALSPYVKGGGAKQYEQELKKMYGMDGSMDGTVGGFQAMTNDMLTVLNDIPFSIPAYFALLARAVVTLEGLALSADPSYGLVVEAYPFVARKLLASDRPELQQALQQVLYSGTSPGGEGMRGVITPTRLAGLLNSAAGIVAKQEGQAFVDLDAVPEDGVSAAEALSYVLSPGAASLRTLLAAEAETAADLLLRQALRKSVPLIAAAVPQPPTLPFFPPLPEPLDLPLPLLLPSASPTAVLTSPDGVGALPSTLLSSSPLLTTGQELLDAVAPSLTREEELYAISLTDLARSSFGDDAADLISGNLAQEPRAAARAAVPLLEALVDAATPHAGAAGGEGDGAVGSPAALQLARTTVGLLKSLPGVGGAAPAAEEKAHGGGGGGLGSAVTGLDGEKREVLREALGRVGSSLASKMDARLMALRR